MKKFSNIPNYTSLNDNNAAYFTDSEYVSSLQNKLNTKHGDLMSRIKVQPLTFINSMINSMSSLYTEKFIRVTKKLDNIDETSLEIASTYVERFYRLHRRAAYFLSTNDEGKIEFTALDPTRYFKQGFYSFVSVDDANCVLYMESPSGLEIYDISLPISDAVFNYDLEKKPVDQYENLDEGVITQQETTKDTILKSPIVEVTEYNSKKADLNNMVTLQEAFISDISWGIYVGSIKLITQPILESNTGIAKTAEMLKNFGSTSEIIQVGTGNKLTSFDPGDVKVLLDLFKMYTEILKQIAVQKGADITAVIPTDESGNESAVAKMIKLNYINKARKDHKMVFKVLEADLWNAVKDAFNVDVGYESITFPALKINETPAEALTYNERLYNLNLLNFQQFYATTFDISYNQAAIEIAKYNLSPEDFDSKATL